jgi:hypothetical protein
MSRRRRPILLAVAGFFASLAIVASLDNPSVRAQPPKAPAITPAPQAPTLTSPANLGAKAGESVEVTLTGTNLSDPVGVALSGPGKATIPTDNKNGIDAAKLRVKFEVPADCPIGLYTIRVATKSGVSNIRPFVVDELPVVAEVETNRKKDGAQAVSFPVVVTGRTDTEASDYFRFKVSAGQTVTFEVLARRIGSPLDPIIVLHDAKTRRELVALYSDDTPGLQSDCRLTHTFKEAGEFLVEVRDTTYRGGNDYFYRLRIGEIPGATTAFPVAAQRGKSTKVGFAGPNTSDIPPVAVKAPKDEGLAAVYVAPKRASGASGWPVPVRLSDDPESIEQEPNNEAKAANKLPVPGGVSARFEKSGDLDHFVVACKKGTKYAAAAMTYELNSPAEVLIRVQDAKGAEIARSNPMQQAARAEFTAPADGDYIVACEQLNYLAGPNEIYHLSVQPVAGDFAISLAFDRGEAPPGSGTAVLATVARQGGFAGPVELSIDGDEALTGKAILPAGQTIGFVPLLIKEGTEPGAHSFRVQGKATIDGKEVVRFGTLVDPVKATLGGMPNPPLELLNQLSVGAVEKPALDLKLAAEPARIDKGKAGKIVVEAVRGKDADAEIAIAPLFAPPNVTAATKPLPKGMSKGEIGVTVAAGAAAGPATLTFRATTKVGGKDVAVIPLPVVIDVVEPKKKEEPKKDEKKESAKKKDEKKKP